MSRKRKTKAVPVVPVVQLSQGGSVGGFVAGGGGVSYGRNDYTGMRLALAERMFK